MIIEKVEQCVVASCWYSTIEGIDISRVDTTNVLPGAAGCHRALILHLAGTQLDLCVKKQSDATTQRFGAVRKPRPTLVRERIEVVCGMIGTGAQFLRRRFRRAAIKNGTCITGPYP